MKRAVKVFLCALLFFSVPAAGHCGQEYPRRIVSLVPALTEEIYLLGAEDGLLADTVYCSRPAPAAQKEKIGTVTQVNLEKIVSLKPDLVLACGLTDRNTIAKLKGLGIKTVVFMEPESLDDICGQFIGLGALLGREKKAREIAAAAKSEAYSIKEEFRDASRPSVLMQIGARPLFVATADSYLNDIIVFSGGDNVIREKKIGLYSREEVVRLNPEVIIIANMGMGGIQEKDSWLAYKNLSAVKTGRIYIVDSGRLCSPTPENFIEMVRKISILLHKGGNVRSVQLKANG